MTYGNGRAVTAAVRRYRTLLKVLPADYRDAVGEEWCQVFRDELVEVRRTGGVAVIAGFWLRVMLDLAILLPGAWWSSMRSRNREGAAGSGYGKTRVTARGVTPSLLLTDLMYACRSLRRHPAPVLVSGLSLSLGIAATATMISVVDAIDFRPLPYRDADRLVALGEVGVDGQTASPGVFLDWRERVGRYRSLAAASPIAVAVGDDERVFTAARASEEFFETLEVTPAIGRTFTSDEVRRGARVLVISHDAWQTLFGADPGVIGRTLPISWAGEYRGVAAESFTVIGVLPRGARYPRGSDVWLPAWDGFGTSRGNAMLFVVGRLEPGVSISGTRAELDAVSRQLAIDYPDAPEGWSGAVSSFRDAIQMNAGQRATSARFLLLGVAAFVFALAIINAAVVFLVRAVRQERDLVVRVALGAPRSHLLMLTLGQSLVVSLAAGAFGVLLSAWGIQLADARLSVSASGLGPVLDGRVMIAALALSLFAGLAVGIFPAVRLAYFDRRGRVRAPTARGSGVARGGRLQRALVVGQVACALVLLTGAGTLTRDFVTLVTRDLGFDAEGLVVAWLPFAASHEGAVSAAERVAGLPGIADAALGGRPAGAFTYRFESGDSLPAAASLPRYRVSPNYFTTLGIPLLAGRAFGPSDHEGSTPVAIVSEAAARAWWPGETPVGKQLLASNRTGVVESVRIVGITGDERLRRDLESSIGPILYRPWRQLQNERRRTQLFARAAGGPEALVPQVRAVVRELRDGAGWQGDRVTTMAATVGDSLDLQRFRTSALTLFSVFGLLLASMGVYGVVASIVNQRTAEIGIRLALGARAIDVLALVARGGMGLAAAGMVLGLAGALAVHRVFASLVVSTSGLDPVPMLAAGGFLAASVVAACYVPARRAVRIDPTAALRD
jgi:predicted permease